MFRTILVILIILALPPLDAAPVFQTIADFERAGTIPAGNVIAHPDENYYGTTVVGGRDGYGTIFRMSPSGAVTTLISFTGDSGSAKGAYPSGGLTLGSDGSLYGTTANGGAGDLGTIFKITPTGTFTNLLDFTGIGGGKKGSVPNPLFLHTDGFFYGSTQAGGESDLGTVFKMTNGGALTTLAELTGTSGTRRGTAPSGRLVVNGSTIYGTTQFGGTYDLGTVFSLAGTQWNMLVAFTGVGGAKRGSGPISGLTHLGGTLYGTTEYGGADDFGTIFRVATNGGSFTTMRDLTETSGAFPAGPLLPQADGCLYGTTRGGGPDDVGVIFKIPASTPYNYSVLSTFADASGAAPRGELIAGPGGELIGITEAGGPAENGTVYQMSASLTRVVLASFTTPNGWRPIGAPLAAANGIVIPLQKGGVNGYGTALHITADSTVTLQNSFNELTESPAGGFLDVFGQRLGLSENGTFFNLPPSLPPTIIGTLPSATGLGNGDLLDGGDGYFYGVSSFGGTHGTVFRISLSGVPSLVAAFSGSDGANPSGPLARGQAGNFYGTTEAGGFTGNGTVFKVETSGTITTLTHFAATGPRAPTGGLVASIDGTFYGTSKAGGSAGLGTVFRITPLGALTVLTEFTGLNGSRPGRLLAACDSTIYGTTEAGGTANSGTFFRITTEGIFEHLFSFNGVSGSVRGNAPTGHLSFSGGAIHGVAPQGGLNGGGTAFRIIGTGPHTATRLPVRINSSTLALNATVQSGGESTSVIFDYGPTPTLGLTTVPASPSGATYTDETFSAQIPPPAPGQTVHFRARATNVSGLSKGMILNYTSPMPASQWKIDHFGDANAPDLGDPDNDGIANILEYALVLNPIESSTTPPPSRVIFPEGPRLSLWITRDPQRSDITIEVQAAPAPDGPWMTVASSSNGSFFVGAGYVAGEVPGNAVRTVQIKDSAAAASGQTRFMRIKVVH